MKVKKTVLKIVFIWFTFLLVTSCVMDKVDCRLKIINKSSSNYGVKDWTNYAGSVGRISSKSQTEMHNYFNIYFERWDFYRVTNPELVTNQLYEHNFISRNEYSEICGPRLGYDTICLLFHNIDSLFYYYINKIPLKNFDDYFIKCYNTELLKANDYKIEFTGE